MIINILRSVVLCAVLLGGLAGGSLQAGEKWLGVDDAVVNKIAREHGREAQKSLIDTGQGDLQLFAFLLAGTVGGFVAGYYWRVLLEGRNNPADKKTTG